MLNLKSEMNEFILSFIKTFKENTNIKNYQWTLKYNSNNEGLLILGDSITEYDPQFKTENILSIKHMLLDIKTI